MALLITADQVLEGPAGARIKDGAVLIDAGVIVAVGPRGVVETLAGPDVERSDHPGATVLPGLINCHVHLAFDAGPDPVGTLGATDDAALALGMAERARQLLDGGVTTARDLGDRGALSVGLRDTIAAGGLPGPRILAATAPLTPPGGHCWFLGGEVDGTAAIRERIRRNVAAGADLIKVMASGGQMTPGGAAMWESQFDTEHLRVVVAEAHEAGLRVAAHAHGTASIVSAVDAGVDSLEHCTWLTDGAPDEREDVAVRIVEQGIHVCSAMSPNWRAFIERLGPERAERSFARLRWMDALGVRLVTGTDAGLPFSAFGDFVGALGLYEHLGFPPEQIVEMATTRSAAALGLSDETGRLASGLAADLLVVRGDPTTDLEALRDPALILARGRRHPG
ncbi:amidohydrolase family protein [Streptomyces sp. SID3343]|uniref:amidohydrolase family protein n=1 Tax=Streptomyces sp. SID3343 TaxID=2690260 RepID=UPI0013714BD9|nr:amidohydrolase family protein [Streptomyces sp. SID3343]MYW05193.1 amidohydrolase family protein [Streptomyces sp. SID3343]